MKSLLKVWVRTYLIVTSKIRYRRVIIMSEQPQLIIQIEALLFVAGRPMSSTQLARLAKSTPKKVTDAITELTTSYQQSKRGISIIGHENKFQMVSNPVVGATVENFRKEEFTGPLSRAALETLSLVAYRGPIIKPEIDAIRGVNSAIMLRTLLIRGLVERKRSKQDARSYSYSLSFDLMRHLGITKVSDLPRFEELRHHEVLERFAQAQADASIKPSSNITKDD